MISKVYNHTSDRTLPLIFSSLVKHDIQEAITYSIMKLEKEASREII